MQQRQIEQSAEQDHVDTMYARLDGEVARVSADLADAVRASSTDPEEAFTREVRVRMLNRRARTLGAAEHHLCFGRIDHADGSTLHIGRTGLSDGDDQLLVDWRADAARPFYAATAAHTDGAAPAQAPAPGGPQGHAGERRAPGRRRARTGGPRRGRAAAGGHRGPAYRPHARRRLHAAGRAGRDHPLRAPRRHGRGGRSGHWQDGGRPAPRRLRARGLRRSAGRRRARARPELALPRLHRGGAAVARRERRGDEHRRPPRRRGSRPRPGRRHGPRGGPRAAPRCRRRAAGRRAGRDGPPATRRPRAR